MTRANCSRDRAAESGRRIRAVCRTALSVLLLAASVPAAVHAAESGLRGPDITIIAEEEKTIYEYRQNGVLRMVRIVPKWGKPYYLVPADPTKGYGDLERADMLIPSWVLIEF
jgi:hypothetical protein